MVYNDERFISLFSNAHGSGIALKKDTFKTYIRLYAQHSESWIISNFKYFISLFRIIKVRKMFITLDSSESSISMGGYSKNYCIQHTVIPPLGSKCHTLWIDYNSDLDHFLRFKEFDENSFAYLQLVKIDRKTFIRLNVKRLGDGKYISVTIGVTKERILPQFCTNEVVCKLFSRSSFIGIKSVILFSLLP